MEADAKLHHLLVLQPKPNAFVALLQASACYTSSMLHPCNVFLQKRFLAKAHFFFLVVIMVVSCVVLFLFLYVLPGRLREREGDSF